MAVLSKIRQRSMLLILVIGFCLLAFIVGDIIQNGSFGITRNIGSVNGQDIAVQDFMLKVNNMQARQRGMSPTQAANTVWNQEVEYILFEERCEAAGIRVGKDHVINMYAQDPSVFQNPQFQNALGKFDKAKFNEFLVNMKTTNPEQWRLFESSRPQVENLAKKQIYVAMVKAGFVTTDADAQAKYKFESDKVSFDYVFVPYNTINDDEVEVSDQEIIDYMKKNEKKYKSEASRSVEFVVIENKPSAEDEAEIKDEITALLSPKVEYNAETKTNDTVPGFRGVSNVEDFVNKNSEIPFDTTYVTKKQLPLEYAEQLYNLAPGEVFGPYIDNGYYKLTKMINKKGNASVNASHILIAHKDAMRSTVTRTKEEAKAKADDLLKQINANPSSFAALVMANTDDPGSKNTGGVYENIMPGQMVKPFNDFVFNKPVGATGVVETDFGYHVIKVTGKNEAVQLATIARKIQSSEATADAVFQKASKFEMDAESKDFAALAKEMNLTVQTANKIMANDESVQGIGNQRAIVKWAFDDATEVGDVSKFDVPQGHVIARVKAINEKGFLPIEEAKLSVLPIIRNEKKAELIRKKMEGSTIEAVSQKTGSAVASATDITMAAPMIPGVGSEPKVVGKAFGIGQGKTSGHIDGNMGVFMVKTKTITKAPALSNYSSYITRIKSQERNSMPSRFIMALKDGAEIEDNRGKVLN